MHFSEANSLHEVVLSILLLYKVTPFAQVGSHHDVLVACSQSLYDLCTGDLVSENSLPVQIDLSPKEIELLFHVVLDISVYQTVSLVIFVDYI